ncbi:sugar transferase [Planococcus sp. ISL-109]|uniref:sugar transferase n=1 Tax=Planococcus sp. ISL-109 TaxID=2819166 RepID=UPI001BE96F20|nr:sugar transferase [Planococcus sp. ISL-109]MBT2581540.1 sugar transferase [Planococcus sp. ISL-109]
MIIGDFSEVQKQKQPKRSNVVARFLEIITAVLMLLVLSPLFLTVTLLIRLESKGPAMFKQQRGGLYGRHFTIYKFRTMEHGRDKKRNRINPFVGDPSITKVGNILRKTSIDELPQLINIVKGDMAFIGPRPTVTDQTDNYNDYQKQRLLVKPGVTGLAQVSGRNTLTWDEKIEIDIDYINRKSLRLDLYILMQTFVKVFRTEEVYEKS